MPFLILVLALTGCAKVQSEPFAKFSASISEGQKSVEKTMTEMQKFENDHLVRTIHEEKTPDKLNSYKFTMSPDDFKLSNDKYYDTYLMMITNLNEKMTSMNGALKKYAELLCSISSATTIDSSQLSTIQKELKSAFDQGVTALKNDAKIDYSKATEGLSSIFANMLQDFANAYQKKILVDAIEKNQKSFESYADVCKTYSILYLNAYYDHCYIPTYNQLVKEYSEIRTDKQQKDQKNDPESQQKEKIAKLIELNLNLYNARQFSLNLISFYSSLPEAHKELGENLKSNKLGFEFLNKMFTYVQNLKSINDALISNTNAATTNQQ
jgi:hypothetical protein